MKNWIESLPQLFLQTTFLALTRLTLMRTCDACVTFYHLRDVCAMFYRLLYLVYFFLQFRVWLTYFQNLIRNIWLKNDVSSSTNDVLNLTTFEDLDPKNGVLKLTNVDQNSKTCHFRNWNMILTPCRQKLPAVVQRLSRPSRLVYEWQMSTEII